jgi:predicted CXXCH cytochrome family protein
MTQVARKDTVLAPLDTPVDAEGTQYVLSADAGGAVWERAGGTENEKERVLLTTGSHHMQGYWVAGRAGALRMLPFVYARDEQRVVLRREAFVEPPGSHQPDVRWGSNCIACHATAGEPRARPDGSGYDTRVTELGIACEACHGPGAAHVERYGDPVARYAQHLRGGPDSSIVDPARLPADLSAAVCGQCHAYAYPRDEDAFWRSGYVGAFRPGQALDASRFVLSPAVLGDARGPKLDLPARDLFWPDATVRVAGREYNAMTLSACFLRGEGERKLTCTSCHSMHASDPDDQLRRDRSVQAACLSCHAMPAGHSRHAPGSAGDACVACHMPKTSYALRTAIRSHRVDSPDADPRGRPGACNLCHLDRSVAWTARSLAAWRAGGAWSDAPPPSSPSPAEPRDIPESVKGLLTRDAAERVLWADAMGDPDALAASGSDWEGTVLDYAAREDRYAVVRYVAARSRRAVDALAHGKPPAHGAAAAMSPRDIAAIARNRDDRDITVAE